jgi:Flp pilus assembly protein TadD/serine/threonine protein kinase
MEYVEGDTLAGWLGEPRPAPAVLEVVRQVAGAVAYAHGRGVVHCDLKPGNVLVTRQGQAKVVDFGIAQMQRTAATTRLGETTEAPAFTPRYAAPEVKQGARPVPASDVYSLGVLLEEVVDECARAGAPLPSPVAQDLRRAARHACAIDVARRPRDGAAFLATLPTSADVNHKSVGRLYPALFTVLMLVAGGLNGGLSLAGKSQARPRQVVAVATRADAAAAVTLSASLADAVTSDLSRLANVPVVSDGAPALRQESMGSLFEEAERLGITHVIVPTVRQMKEALSATLSVYEVSTRQLRWSRTVRADEQHLFERQEALTRGLATELGWSREPTGQPVSPPKADVDPQALAYYSQSRTFLERVDVPGHVDTAISLLEKSLAIAPGFAAARATLGRAYWARYATTRQRIWADRSVAELEQAKATDPSDVPVRLMLARHSLAVGRADQAEVIARRILDMHPASDEACAVLGGALSAAGRHAEAVSVLQRAVDLRPGFSGHVRALATAYFDAGNLPSAERQFRELSILQPDSVYAWQNLAAVLQLTGRTSEAVACYERVLAIRPLASAHTNLGTIAFDDGDYEKAIREFRKAVSLAPSHPVYRRNLADGLRKAGLDHEAVREYGRTYELAVAQLEVTPGDTRLMGLAALAAATAGRPIEAERLALRAVAASGGNHSARLTLAGVYARVGQPTRARDALREAFRAGAPVIQVLKDDVLTSRLGEESIRAIAKGGPPPREMP